MSDVQIRDRPLTSDELTELIVAVKSHCIGLRASSCFTVLSYALVEILAETAPDLDHALQMAVMIAAGVEEHVRSNWTDMKQKMLLSGPMAGNA